MTAKLTYVIGDARFPQIDEKGTSLFSVEEPCVIVHIVNNIGVFGAGFAKAIGKTFYKVHESYRVWFYSQNKFELGEIQTVKVLDNVIIVNLIGQDGTYNHDNLHPLQFDAVEKGLEKVAMYCKENNIKYFCCPRIGAGLAVGCFDGYCEKTWEKIEKLLIDKIINEDIDIFVYDLPECKL